jgi:hypothetical protein
LIREVKGERRKVKGEATEHGTAINSKGEFSVVNL